MSASTRPRLYCVAVAAACLIVVSLAGTASCTAERAERPAGVAAAGAAADLPLKEFMGHVIAYSAQNIWDRQGWVSDENGEHSQFPKNDHEWEQAESAALTLSELMPLLLQSSRRMNVPQWESSTLAIRELSRQAAQAAEGHDEAAFFALGTRIDEACDDCHRAAGITS